MTDIRSILIYVLAAGFVMASGWAWIERRSAEKARGDLSAFVAASEAASELQREKNRGRAGDAVSRESVRTVYRDRFITNIVREVEHVSAPLAACPLPAGVVSLLNRAATCAADDTSTSCGAGDGVRPPG